MKSIGKSIGSLLILLLVGNSQLLAGTVEAQQLDQPITAPSCLAGTIEPSTKKKDVSYVEPIPYKPSIYCNCKAFLEASGIILPKVGNNGVKAIKPTHTKPFIGAVVITMEGPLGHVAHVDDIVDNYLILNEANYVRCQQTKGRKLSIDSALILGYYKNMGGD